MGTDRILLTWARSTPQGVIATGFGGPDVSAVQEHRRKAGGEVRIRQTAVGVNYIDVYVRKGLYKMIVPPAPIGMEAAGVVVESNSPELRPGDRVAYASGTPGAYVTMRAHAGERAGPASGVHRRRDGGRADAQGHDRRISPAPYASCEARRCSPGARSRRRRRAASMPVGESARRAGDRHGVERSQGGFGARERLRSGDCHAGLPLCLRR